LGAAGDVFLQDFITIHRFSESTVARITSINNNNTYTTIGDGSATTPYFCTTATNKCGGARFGEFSVIPYNMSVEELVSLGSDIANKWCVPFAGPSIKKFRLVNVGATAVTIGYVGMYKSAFDLGSAGSNLIAPSPAGPIYSGSGAGKVLSGDALSASLVFAFDGDAFSDASNSINGASVTKTLTADAAGGGARETSVSKYYDASYRTMSAGGAAGSVRVANFPSSIFANDLTIEFWVYLWDTSRSISVFGSHQLPKPAGFFWCIIDWSGGLGRVGIGADGWSRGDTAYVIQPSTWTHIALVKTGASQPYPWVVYINGVSSLSYSLNTGSDGRSVTIGGDFGGGTSKANFNDVRIYLSKKYAANFSVTSPSVARSLSTGQTPSASWGTATAATAPFEVIPSGGHLECELSSVVENCGFMQLGKITTTTSAKLRLDVQCNATVSTWEQYNLWYHYNGAACEATTQDCAPLNVTNGAIYAKDGVLMPWKAKYGSIAGATAPYYIPRYQAALEGSATQLQTWSANLLGFTWDCDRATKWYDTNKKSGSFSENQIVDFWQFSENERNNNSQTQSQIDQYTSKDGRYSLGRVEVTKLDYLPASVLMGVGKCNARFQQSGNTDVHSLGLGFMDPETLRGAVSSSMMVGDDRLHPGIRLRKSPSGRWYIDLPLSASQSVTIADSTGTTWNTYNPRWFPEAIAHQSARVLFGYPGPDPTIGRIIQELELQKKYTIATWIGNSQFLFYHNAYNSYPGMSKGDVTAIVAGAEGGSGTTDSVGMVVSANVCTQLTLQVGRGVCVATALSENGYTRPTYHAPRTLTRFGNADNDGTNFSNSSGERLFMLTVVVNTQANSGAFNSESTMRDFVAVYVNGKRVNTQARIANAGSGIPTVTTSVALGGSTYPTGFTSAALTYGITQINNSDANAIRNTKHPMVAGTNSIAAGIRSIATMSDVSHPNTPSGRRISFGGTRRLIMLEMLTENRSTIPYGPAEVAAHIGALSVKWGIPMAYRWITIVNEGTATFSFARLGLYCSHSEAFHDTTGDKLDPKTSTYMNIMKGYTGTVANPVTVGVGGATPASVKSITAVLSMSGASQSAADAAPSAAGQAIDLPGGSSITIDLADSVTCSHLRFGQFYTATAADYASLRMSVKLISTEPGTERPGIIYAYDLLAGLNTSNVVAAQAAGQFPLHAGPINARTDQFMTANASTHVNTCGVYALVANGGGIPVTDYRAPSNFINLAIASPGTLTAFVTARITATVFGLGDNAARVAGDFKVHLFATAGPSYTCPADGSRNCTVTGYSLTSGVVMFDARPTVSGSSFTFVVFVYDSSAVLIATLPYGSTHAVVPGIEMALELDATNAASYPGSGTTWFDLSGNGNNATLTGAGAAYSTTSGFKAIAFDSSSGRYAKGTFSASPFNGAHSLFVWCYQTQIANYATPVADDGGTSGIDFYQQGHGLGADADSSFGNSLRGNTWQSATTIGLLSGATSHMNKWICISICNSNYTVGSRVTSYGYNNGSLFSDSGYIMPGDYARTNKYVIGKTSSSADGAFMFVGHVGYVAIYPSQLSLEQFVVQFNATRAKFGVSSDIVLPSFTQIYKTDMSAQYVKTAGFSTDPSAASLVLAFPCDATSDVSASINASSVTRTVSVKFSGQVVNTNARFYGNSFQCQKAPSTGGGSIEFSSLPSNMFNSTFTIEMWFRPTAVQGGTNCILQIGAWNTSGQLWVTLKPVAGGVELETNIRGASPVLVKGNPLDVGNPKYALDTWHHFALVRDATKFRFYVNGITDVVRAATTLPSVSNIWIGGFDGQAANDFYGQVQDMRIYTSVKYTGPFVPTVVALA
jgi:hypothetical protein